MRVHSEDLPYGVVPSVPEKSADNAIDAQVADAGDNQTPPRRRAWIAPVLAMVVALALAAAGLLLAAAAPAEVPFVIGRTTAAAEKSVVDARLTPGTAMRVPTSQYRNGMVLDQAPPAYTQVPQHSSVDVTVSVSPEVKAVPDLRSAPQDLAEKTLAYLLYEPVVYRQYAADVPVGLVVSQLPRSGQSALTGSPVVIVVSLGPGKGGSVVPELVGESSAEASKTLSAARLFAQWLSNNTTATPAGSVFDQVPAPGAHVPVGSHVALAVGRPVK